MCCVRIKILQFCLSWTVASLHGLMLSKSLPFGHTLCHQSSLSQNGLDFGCAVCLLYFAFKWTAKQCKWI